MAQTLPELSGTWYEPLVRRALGWSLGIAVVVGLGVGGVVYRRSRPAPGPHYTTVAVDRGRIVARVTATGTLSALVTVQVGSQVSGRLQTINVDFNSPVK